MQEGQRGKRRDRQRTRIGEDGQRQHMEPGRRIGYQHHPKPVESICERAAEGREDHVRDDIEHANDGEPRRGTRSSQAVHDIATIWMKKLSQDRIEPTE